MRRKVHTDFITSLLKKALGADAETANLAVYEVVATSTSPLKKKGLYEKAVITPLTLAQMAQHVNASPVPLMMDHNMEGMPKGKFFYAELHQAPTRTELRGLMYVDPSETELMAKADVGTVDETSVGFLPSSIKCSACSWDYMAALRAGNIEPIVSRKCPNGHTLNQAGVHARVDGLEDFMELSVVSRGAAPNSKIIGNDNAKFSGQIEKLAASGFDVNELYLTASASEGVQNVDLNELILKLGQTTTDLALKGAEVITLTARADKADTDLAAVNVTLAASTARVAELEAELVTAKAETAPSEDAAALTAAQDFLSKQYTAVLTAAGETDITVPATVKEMVDGIEAHRAKLSAIFPVGGVSLSADHQEKDGAKADARIASFKRKN